MIINYTCQQYKKRPKRESSEGNGRLLCVMNLRYLLPERGVLIGFP
jgi:hypothetical protein